MSKKIKTLAKHSAIYGLGSVLTASAGFILIPIYTHALSTTEYGVLEILNRIADVLILVMFMGVRQAYVRIYFDKETDEWKKTVTASALVFSLISSIIISFLMYLFSDLLITSLLASEIDSFVILLVLMWLPLEMVINIGLSFLQVNLRSRLYIGINLIRLLAFVSLNYIFLYHYEMGVEAIFVSQLIITGIISSAFIVYFIKLTHIKVSYKVVKELLHFGLPYIPTTFFAFILTNSDKYFLAQFSGLEEVGIYALGSKIGMLGVMVLMEPFNKVWSPFVFSNYKTPEGPKIIGDVFLIFTSITVYVALGIAIVAPGIIPLISSAEFHSAHTVVPLIALSSALYSIVCLADIGILIAKKTKYKPFITFFAAVVCVLSTSILVYQYGIIGAAMALVITQVFYYIATKYISNKFYKMKLSQMKLAIIFAVGIIVYLIVLNIDLHVNIYLELAFKVALSTVLFTAGLMVTGIISKDVINDVKYFLFSRKQGS